MKLVFRTLLLALILSPVDAVLAETQRFSKWTFASQTDEFTDKVSVSIYSELKRGFHLTLACADNKPFLMVGSLFEETVLFSKVVYADFRVDSKRAISFQGTGVDSIIAFSSNDESSMLVEYFRNGRKLLFRADDFRGRRFTDTISLDGFDMALDHFANYCPKRRAVGFVCRCHFSVGKICGNSFQVRPSRVRPVFFLFLPPHCLK